MTGRPGRGWGRVGCWAGALMLTVTLAGCGNQDDDPEGSDVANDAQSSNDAGSLSPEQADARMAQYRETVRADTREVGRAVAEAVGGQLKFASGRNTLCTDDGAGWSYDVSGRVDPPADAPRPLYQTVSSTLKEIGYAVEELVAPTGDTRVIADRDTVTVTVQEYTDAPILLFRVSSPCLIIPEEQRDSYPREDPSPDVVPRPE